jgi:hypothetical protein
MHISGEIERGQNYEFKKRFADSFQNHHAEFREGDVDATIHLAIP